MKGDFTRVTFDPAKHYSRVLEQQGRVQVDSDFNEMNDIHRYFLRRLAADLIGPHGGPDNGFKIGVAKDDKNQDVLRDFEIAFGRYYVDGVLCENDVAVRYTGQRVLSSGAGGLKDGTTYLAYLDVWERHVTPYEDENDETIGIREVALRGPDTATRAQVVWRVNILPIEGDSKDDLIKALSDNDPTKVYGAFRDFLSSPTLGTGRLRARARKPQDDDEPCLISPESKYRGAENQLYRVEIHRGGVAMPSDTEAANRVDPSKVATFKWSRENGSVIFPIVNLADKIATVRDLGREQRFGLRRDDWVEVVDDDYALQNRAEPLLQVVEVDRDSMQVTLKTAPATGVGTDSAKHPLLRRWDQPSEPAFVVEMSGDEDETWITLEDGVQIQFVAPPAVAGRAGNLPNEASLYRTGDYWLIPARVATGDVEWPGPAGDPRPRPPHGVEHGYAPLGLVSVKAGGNITLDKDLRRPIKQLWLP